MVSLAFQKKGNKMKFYRKNCCQIFIVEIMFFAFFILSFFTASKIDKIIMCTIFVFSIFVSLGLILYFKQNIVKVYIINDDVKLIRNDRKVFILKNFSCTKIVISDHIIKLYFKDGSEYRIQKYYDLLRTPIFDFNIFNNNNFPNAVIENM